MFRIGMRVVAIMNHSSGFFKKGDVFEVLGVMTSPCKCNINVIQIGISRPGVACCYGCNTYDMNLPGPYLWFHQTLFRPVQDQYTSEEIEAVNIDELTEVLNEPELETINQ